MTAALDSGAARRKSSRAATASRQKNSVTQFPRRDAMQSSRKRATPASRKEEKSSLVGSANPGTAKQSIVRTLPQPQPLPLWLRGLFALQQGSTLITLLLLVGGLGVYGWTVYTQQRWSDAYRRLENLQKRERQFLTTNEVLKNQMAEQAEAPGVGLVPPDPSSTIFLSPAPLRPAATPEVPPSSDAPIPARPLGY